MLAVNNIFEAVSVAYDDGAEKVMPIFFNLGPLVTGLMILKKSSRQIIEQLLNLLCLPFVVALIIVDSVFRAVKKLADCLGVPPNFFHFG